VRWGNWLIGACCALFVAVIVTPTGVYEGVWKLATGKDAAAWVQAIGSILAIFAAIGVAAYQNAREEKRRVMATERAANVRMQAATWAAELALAAVGTVPLVLREKDQRPVLAEFGFPRHTFDDAGETIDRLPLHEFEVPEVAVALVVLRTLVRGTSERAKHIQQRLKDGQPITFAIWRDLIQRAKDARAQRDQIYALAGMSPYEALAISR
jgi:hypothetical protein